MKKKNLIIALTLTLSLGIGVTAYAESNSQITNCNNTSFSNRGLGGVYGLRGYDFMSSILKNKLSMTDSDISSALNSNKTMYQIAKEKGMTDEQIKSAMLEERINAVDTSVKNGTITKEQGDIIKSNIKDNSLNCTPGKTDRKGLNNVKRGCGNYGTNN